MTVPALDYCACMLLMSRTLHNQAEGGNCMLPLTCCNCIDGHDQGMSMQGKVTRNTTSPVGEPLRRLAQHEVCAEQRAFYTCINVPIHALNELRPLL